MQIKGPPSALPLTLGYCFAQSFTLVLGLRDFFFFFHKRNHLLHTNKQFQYLTEDYFT